MTNKTLLRNILIILGLLALLGVGLVLDLANRGLAWQFFWNQTGEEEPVSQIRGMVEWVGNLTRPQPLNDATVPIDHANENPFGINTFLQIEPAPEKVEAQVQMLSEAGFAWIRQEFTWEDIEVDGRGQYTDSRNDMDGDGVADTIDAWAKYDRIVDLTEQYGVKIQARLSNPPAWSRSYDDPTGLGPPDDWQDYLNFAVATAERYKGRIHHYQIWNEPNIFPEWGAQADGTPNAVNPEVYTGVLCRTYDALKAIDPEIVVISGALAPTSSLSDRDLNDYVYLQRMYDAGASACFDVLSMQGYGLNSGPTDRRMRPSTVNFGRNQYIRDIMVKNGDAHKPIWISEAAWNFVPTEAEHPEPISGRLNYGQVTMEQASEYMPLAYERVQQEWAWIGVMNYWYMARPNDLERDQSWYYFRMVEPEFDEEMGRFKTLPIYEAMSDYINTIEPTLYQGVHQLDGHWAVDALNPATVEDADAQFGEAVSADSLIFTAQGTRVMVRWKGERLTVQVGDESHSFEADGESWQNTTIAGSTFAEKFEIQLQPDGNTLIDSVLVSDQSMQNTLPFVVISALLVAGFVALIIQRVIHHC